MNIVIRNYMEKDLDSLNCLLQDVYELEKKSNVTDNIELVAVYQEEIVGYLTLHKLHDSVKDLYYFFVNYVCVKKEYRKHGIGTMLFDRVFDLCRKENISYVELTSNEKRMAAHSLYQSLGFYIRSTDVFRKEIL